MSETEEEKAVRAKIKDAMMKVLQSLDESPLENYDAMEVFVRCTVNVGMTAMQGDHALSAEWLKTWAVPLLQAFIDQLAEGGKSQPSFISGQRVQ